MPAHNKLVTTINVVPSVGVDADDEVGLMLMPGFVVPCTVSFKDQSQNLADRPPIPGGRE